MGSDIIAYLYSNNTKPNIELRGQYAQQYFPETFAKIAKFFQGQPLTNSTIVTDSPKEQPIKHASETTELPVLAESNSSDDLKSLTIKAPVKQNKVKIPTIINETSYLSKQ